jgi:maleylpyruvate isomerase
MPTDQSAGSMPDPAATLAHVQDATAHLLTTVEQFDDEAVRAPSLLPDWTRGHVLTHAARNADALVRLLTWARTGEPTPMYATAEARDAEIEQGANRSAAELLADLREASGRFAEYASGLTAEQWANAIEGRRGGPQAAGWLPWWRLEEVLIHHVDLGVSFSPAHWPDYFTEPELGLVAARFSNPVFTPDSPAFRVHAEDTDAMYPVNAPTEDGQVPIVRGPSAALVAWLIGRSKGDGLNVEPHGELPAAPTWK